MVVEQVTCDQDCVGFHCPRQGQRPVETLERFIGVTIGADVHVRHVQ